MTRRRVTIHNPNKAEALMCGVWYYETYRNRVTLRYIDGTTERAIVPMSVDRDDVFAVVSAVQSQRPLDTE